MKIRKFLPILALVTSACGTQESFQSGSDSGVKTRTLKKRSVAAAEVQEKTDNVDAGASPRTKMRKPSGESTQASDEEKTSDVMDAPKPEKSPALAFNEQVAPMIDGAVKSQLALDPKALSPSEAAALTQSLTALVQGAALGQGADANDAAVKAVLDVVGKSAAVSAVLGPIPAAINAAKIADIAAAAQKLAAAAAALDLAGIQAALADIIKAIMDLIG